ncbi:hypothetical protein [Rhizobium leguminosarum]|uniref:hypothetical protein n=1 Tax=Rhizobium leguminosarum TaxID=384 RepID=UPI0014425452|nr:hypothetical protein [Rhizobium leguminosarum]MBY5863296.1 hypothetical protein [Rhizobium leguminosarum]NKM04174.1 hypothetical protein [Rhizobium leguminosarum bv. viciae]
MNTSLGYEIKTAANGGFVVRDANNPMQPGKYRDDIAAFTNATDMIAWLAKEHGVPFGGFDVPADKIETVKGVLASGGFVSSDARTPMYDELCEDEGCDHHGTPHVCVNWTAHDGTDANPFYRLPHFEGKIEGDYGDGDTRLRGTTIDPPHLFSWAHVKRYRVIA